MADLPTVRRVFVDGRFGQVHCRLAVPEDAPKAPIVCLHMSPKSGRSYRQVLPFLADERVSLAPDYPGHGESDPPPPEPHVSIADFAESAWAAVDAIGGGPVHFVGYHTGAMVAVEATTQRPDDVLSITSISAPVLTEDEVESLSAAFQPVPIDEDGTRFTVNWQRVLKHRGPGMTLQMAAESFAENLRAGDDYEWGHRAAFAYAGDYNRKLAEIEQPNFVMNPGDDMFDQSPRADSMMKNGRRKDYPQWGHGFLNAFPEEAAAEILAFVHEVEADD